MGKEAKVKKCAIFVLFALITLVSGCGTLAGTAEGFKSDIQTAGKATNHFVRFIKATDNWIKENLW
ncbi:MAG: hypothetical protein HZA27_04505 [Candidatus Omnitrophica bacterium]|nr:hypothetical protein [Candidatus Omnitrophota bacterium]